MAESSGGRNGEGRTGARGDTGLPPTLPGYEVLAPLGAGATSSVWRARRRVDGLVVAVKVLRPAGGDVTAGLHEAGLLARVRHRHVVHLYDVLALPDPVTGRPAAVALATQLAGGGSLAQVLARRLVLSAGELVTALQPVAGALADLHGTGVVHGDLSPGNVLFLRDGMPVLADLGVARITGEEPGQSLGTGATDGMVAPEVVEGFVPTPESDVYQLGALAWHCLTGKPPGPAHDRGELTERAPDLPPGLADLVLRCMAPDPEARPDAEEVALALPVCADPEPVEVAPDADPAHGLTERLRTEARAALDAGPTEGGRRGTGGTHRRGRGTRRLDDGVRGGRPGGSWVSRHVLVPVVLAAASLLLLVAAVSIVRPQLMGAVASDAPSPEVDDAPPAVVPTGEETPGAADVAAPDATGGADKPGPEATGGADKPGPETPGAADVAATDATGGADNPAPEATGGAGSAADARTTTADPVTRTAGPAQTGAPSSVAPEDDELTEVLQDLLDARGEAWERADDVLLAGVVARGSPAEAAETEQLTRLRESGVRYPDVTFRVEDARVDEEAPTDEATTADASSREVDRVRLRATISRAVLEGRDGQGGRLDPVPTSTERVSLELARVGDRWLLWSWEPASSG